MKSLRRIFGRVGGSFYIKGSTWPKPEGLMHGIQNKRFSAVATQYLVTQVKMNALVGSECGCDENESGE